MPCGHNPGQPSEFVLSSVQSFSCILLCDPMDCSMPGLPVHHHVPELTQTHVHQLSDAIQSSHPLSPPSPAFNLSQHQGLFQWVSSLHQVTKALEFQLQHQSFQWICIPMYTHIHTRIFHTSPLISCLVQPKTLMIMYKTSQGQNPCPHIPTPVQSERLNTHFVGGYHRIGEYIFIQPV